MHKTLNNIVVITSNVIQHFILTYMWFNKLQTICILMIIKCDNNQDSHTVKKDFE